MVVVNILCFVIWKQSTIYYPIAVPVCQVSQGVFFHYSHYYQKKTNIKTVYFSIFLKNHYFFNDLLLTIKILIYNHSIDSVRAQNANTWQKNGGSMEKHFENPQQNPIYANIAANLSQQMKEKRLSQSSLVRLCAARGMKISQPTISNILKGNHDYSLSNLLALCSGLEISLEELIREPQSEKPFDSCTTDAIITDPDNMAFKGYMHTYSVYFYQTTGRNSDLIRGTLDLRPEKGICRAELTLYIHESSKSLTKNYRGQMAISSTMRSAYVFLFSKEIGEFCLLVFSHFYLFNKNLKCVMANAVTTSAGSNKRPTIHRMCLSENEIEPETLPYIRGQLLLNEPEILISSKKLEAFRKDPRVMPEFLELLSGAVQNERYLSITEAKLTGSELSESDLVKMISLLRSYSAAPKYNKISRKTDSSVFSILEK